VKWGLPVNIVCLSPAGKFTDHLERKALFLGAAADLDYGFVDPGLDIGLELVKAMFLLYCDGELRQRVCRDNL
jgi:hypothetical protein